LNLVVYLFGKLIANIIANNLEIMKTKLNTPKNFQDTTSLKNLNKNGFDCALLNLGVKHIGASSDKSRSN